MLEGEDGHTAKVIKIDEENDLFTLDLNHYLAGKTLNFDITLVALEPEPELVCICKNKCL